MITADKWVVVTIKNKVEAEFTSSKISTIDCLMLSHEFNEMSQEVDQQAALVDMFKNN